MQGSRSHAQLDTLLKKQQKKKDSSVILNRSSSVSVGIGPSNLNRDPNAKQRRKLYETLPFTTVHGLQFKEHQLHKVLSTKSLQGMGPVTEVRLLTALLFFFLFLATVANCTLLYVVLQETALLSEQDIDPVSAFSSAIHFPQSKFPS